MKKRTEHEEIKRLTDAVDLFAQAMKLKLIECAKNGKRGWDGDSQMVGVLPPNDGYLAWELLKDARVIKEVTFKEDCESKLEPRLVDIANRCMMLWYRHSPDAVAADPVP